MSHMLFLSFIRIKLLISIPVFVLLSSCDSKETIRITGLQLEYLSNPTGIDVHKPRFTWKIESDERGVYQQAYQIIVSQNRKDAGNGHGEVWDSGKVPSGQTVNIVFDGGALQSNREYFWRVRVWIDTVNYYWSDPTFFHTGILESSEWEAEWITVREEMESESYILRKEFTLGKRVKKAYAFVTACGFYDFFLNGEKVGDHVLDPAITDYRKTVLYSTFDVTDRLQRGENAAGVMLGNGAYNLRKTEGRYSWGRVGNSLGNPAFLMQLMIIYSDGSEEVIVSGNSWKYTTGPVTFNNLYGGEDYNAGLELPGWNGPGFNDEEWSQVVVSNSPKGKLKSLMMPPLRVTNTIKPVNMINPSPGVFIYDLGQNIAGWWRIEVKGDSGQVIRIRGDETLNNENFPKPLEEGDSMSTNTRYHPFIWTEYTLASPNREIYEPRFFYSGFRYIEVTTRDGSNPDFLKVEGRVVRTALERNGVFNSSDSLLNDIHRVGIWSQKGNTHSYPTDCPQREKGAYNGDGQVIAESTIHDFHAAAYYTKWLNDMRDSQEENGRIPNTSPVLVGGMGGGVGWGSVYILLPWWMYHYYDDLRVLDEHYPTMKTYLLYLKDLATKDENPDEPYIIDHFYGYWYSLGEWCAPGQSSCGNPPVVNTFYYFYNCMLMAKMADILGKSEDQEFFLSLAESIKEAFNRKFFNPETGLYGAEEAFQTYQLLALHGDLVPEGYHDMVFQTIVDDIQLRDNHLNTGIIGTKYLWPTLVEWGQSDLAYTVATQTTYPGYGFWIKNGSTTFPEDWSAKKSQNHQMFGSVTEYFYKYLAGIQSPLEGNTSRGYKNIYIEAFVPSGLEAADASVDKVPGRIHSSWVKTENNFRHKIRIPANTRGTVALPLSGTNGMVVREGDKTIWENNRFIPGIPGVSQASIIEDKLIVLIESGEYIFEVGSE